MLGPLSQISTEKIDKKLGVGGRVNPNEVWSLVDSQYQCQFLSFEIGYGYLSWLFAILTLQEVG